MEVAIHVRSAAETEATLGEAWTWERSAKLRPLLDQVRSALPELPVDRILYGTEFCENLLPSREEVEKVRRACSRSFTLLTPYAGDAGLLAVRGLLVALHPGDEVVFNDWGTLRMLRREFPHLTPVQGRLMMKSLRDPRVMGLYGDGEQNASLRVLQGSNLDNSGYVSMLSKLGVRLAEVDGLPQGNSFATAGIALSAYLPFGFTSTARVCQAAGLGYKKQDKFTPVAPCRHECQTHVLEHSYSNSPFENREQRFWLVGNTYFYFHAPNTIQSLMNAARTGAVSRLNIQTRLPMLAA